VAWWVVDKFHNILEHDSEETSTSTFTSPSKDQHSNGFHVIKLSEVESVEKDGQPSMYTNLEIPKLKHAQATTPNCNIAFVVKMQLHFNMTSCPHETSSWKLMTISNPPSVDLTFEEFPSKELGELEGEHKDALLSAHT
jgi:hypothetical protein